MSNTLDRDYIVSLAYAIAKQTIANIGEDIPMDQIDLSQLYLLRHLLGKKSIGYESMAKAAQIRNDGDIIGMEKTLWEMLSQVISDGG